MKSTHTPGPWIVCECDESAIVYIEQDRGALHDEEPSTIGEIDLAGDGIDKDTGLANARLIAAAPDLLAACEELVRGFDGETDCTELLDMIDKVARAALSKAKGGEA